MFEMFPVVLASCVPWNKFSLSSDFLECLSGLHQRVPSEASLATQMKMSFQMISLVIRGRIPPVFSVQNASF